MWYSQFDLKAQLSSLNLHSVPGNRWGRNIRDPNLTEQKLKHIEIYLTFNALKIWKWLKLTKQILHLDAEINLHRFFKHIILKQIWTWPAKYFFPSVALCWRYPQPIFPHSLEVIYDMIVTEKLPVNWWRPINGGQSMDRFQS